MQALLDRYAHLPPEYRGGMTNHLPMALHALHELGAGAPRMEAFAARYVRRFDPAAEPPADDYERLHARFADRLRTQGVDATLKECLPELFAGVSAAAFHGVIRTAHAVQSGHRESLAQALAYWTWRWQPTRGIDASAAPMPLRDWFDALAAQAQDLSAEHGLISTRMRVVQDGSAYAGFSGRLQPLPGGLQPTLQALWTCAAQRYADTGNFTVLHLVTGCRAVHALLPWLSETPTLLGDPARAYAAALLVTGAVSPRADVAAATWPEVIAAAIASDDDHVVKLVHACREGQAACGDGPWLAAAARAVAP